MKSVIIIFFILIFSTISHANDLSKKITETANNYISNLIPGEGTTEVSIDLRENYKPDFSILGVREVKKKDNGNKKPVVGFIAGETAPKGRKMGHAGAIIGGKDDTASAKKRIMRESGINIVDSPADIGKTVKEILN